MPLIPASDPAVIEAHRRRLRERAAHHKAEVRRHREALQQTMAALAALDRECPSAVAHSPGEGGIHGHPDD